MRDHGPWVSEFGGTFSYLFGSLLPFYFSACGSVNPWISTRVVIVFTDSALWRLLFYYASASAL